MFDRNEARGKIILRMVRTTKLSPSEIAVAFEDCLRFLANGNIPQIIDRELVVLEEWNLDSEHGVELACDLSTRLGIEIPADENPLIDESGGKKRARTFGEVVDYIGTLSNP
jgi:acyl carrier protein